MAKVSLYGLKKFDALWRVFGLCFVKTHEGRNEWSKSSRNFGAQGCLLRVCCSGCGRRPCFGRINRFFGGVKMGFELLEMNDDLYGVLNEVIRERDELIERYESAKMALEDSEEHCEEFKAEARRMEEERDDAIEHADCEKQFADGLKAERDEARKAARLFRDLYVSQVGRTYPEEYRLPWEAEE